MKTLYALSLSLLILLQPLSKMLLVVEYQVNKNYIAAALCVNKDRPQLRCEGKCHLSKELKATEQHGQELPQSVKYQLETLHFYQPIFTAFFSKIPAAPVTGQSLYCPVAYSTPVFDIFHPPRSLV